ncbi:chorismate mutase [Geminocystis sp. GBBB08]|uniref:chorismate mutase n=1 Tax=Geminocystis sp. GBBB08 TaxID=2604140 RepID=UPI0027E2A58B|nr:chorismate mutase [Geminocystis sp. GBBB08]MBL1208987.1 chorismate mutase [Geminocystis sp. GBBB08]
MENLQFTGEMSKNLTTKVRAIRGATTAEANTKEAMREAVCELLTDIETRNQLDYDDVVSVIFTVTPDLDAVFPAAIARERPHWTNIPLLDIQQMQVRGSLDKCIRVLIYVNSEKPQSQMYHSYLRKAEKLRPDLTLTHAFLSKE